MAIMLTKAIAANAEKPGDAIVAVSKSGVAQTLARNEFAVNDNGIDRLNTWYNGRVAVNPTYYGA